VPRITVAGNVSLDRVGGTPPRPGGCPVFAVHALRLLERTGQVVTRCSEADRPLFARALEAPGIDVTVLDGPETAAFDIDYRNGARTMTVTCLGTVWTAADADQLSPEIGWVHVAPLTRTDFPPDVLAAFAKGRRLSLDGQGLVRDARLGPLRQNDHFDPTVLASASVLKLAEEEAEIVGNGHFDAQVARTLGVAEVLVTRGERGVDIWVEGRVSHIRAAPVAGVETTGAGDAFAVAYVVARSEGASPADAARGAASLVSRLLRERRDASSK
jgi:sugar/nucleoside kinase (ribokinase family)